MNELSYTEQIKRVCETSNEYEKLKKAYKKREEDIEQTLKRMELNESKIKELNNKLLSVYDIKAEWHKDASEKYEEEKAKISSWYKKEIQSIDDAEQWEDTQKENIIRTEYSKLLSQKKQKLQEVTQFLSDSNIKFENAREDYRVLEERIENSTLEENQIRLCISQIASNYDNVAKNEGFVQDLKDPRSVRASEADFKYSSISDKKLVKIAEKMNKGVYASSPDEYQRIPISEILVMAFASLAIVFEGIFIGLKFIYKPVNRIYKISNKLLYIAAVTSLLLFLLTSFGDGIVTVLFIIGIALITAFLGMITYNAVKYSNKAFRKEQNLEYFTVGYYFTYHRDDILLRIAANYFNNLRTETPEQLQTILQNEFGHLQLEKERAQHKLQTAKSNFDEAQKNFDEAQILFEEEMQNLNKKCNEQVRVSVSELQSARAKKREDILLTMTKRNEDNEKARKVEEDNIEQKAIREVNNRKQEISSIKEELSMLESKLQKLQNEQREIVEGIDQTIHENQKNATSYKKGEINIIGSRLENDQISNEFFVGMKKVTEQIGNKAYNVYRVTEIIHQKHPIIIVFDGVENEESNMVTQRFYGMIDSILGRMLTDTYLRAFKFVLIDSQGNRNGIIQNMETCAKDVDALEKYGAIKIITDSTGKAFESVISEQEKVLSNKTVEEINSTNKRSDIMAQYIIMSIRLYEKKSNEFVIKDLKKNLQKCVSNGIIPILFMSNTYFNKALDDIMLSIKEECNGYYYMFDLDSSEANVISIDKKIIKE